MDDLLESLGRGLVSVLRFVFWHVLFEVLLFNLGRIALLAVTFGRFPRASHLDRHHALIGGAGVVVVVGLIFAIGFYNQVLAA